MNKKKWAAALLISVFAAGLALTGCGGNDAGESGPSGKYIPGWKGLWCTEVRHSWDVLWFPRS